MSWFFSRLRTIFLFPYSEHFPFSPHCLFYLTNFLMTLFSRSLWVISFAVFLTSVPPPLSCHLLFRSSFTSYYVTISLSLSWESTSLYLFCLYMMGKSGYVHALQPLFETFRSMKGSQALSFIMSYAQGFVSVSGVFIRTISFFIHAICFSLADSMIQVPSSKPSFFDWSSTVIL